MPSPEFQYLDLLSNIIHSGADRGDRTGTGTRALFGQTIRCDLSNDEFPLFTTKKVHLRSIIHELLWFISGDTNVKYLQDNGVTIWNEWADENGDLGPVYGSQWRNFNGEGVDQLAQAVDKIRNNPNDRRIIVSAWNPLQVDEMKLPPCHMFYQFFVVGDQLNMMMYQRSCDMFLGVPFNIASYSLFLMMMAQVTGKTPGEFIWTGGDCHIYNNHFDQVKEQLSRAPHSAPMMSLNPNVKEIDDFKYEDFTLEGYVSYDAIKAPIAV